MFTPTGILVLCFCACSYSSRLGDYEKELEKNGINVAALHKEFERESEEVREEFSSKKAEIAELAQNFIPQIIDNNTIIVKSELDLNGELANDLFEGDIVLNPEQWKIALDVDPNNTLTRRQAITNSINFWTPIGSPVIPYSFASGFPSDKKWIVTSSLAYWEQRTCIKFTPARSSDVSQIEFNHNANGCNSQVGKQSRKQQVNLGNGCLFPTIVAHEVSHAFGTLHVQSRSDRDNYVIINERNIPEGMIHNFYKEPQLSKWYGRLDNYGIPYEFGSMQHYHHMSFATDKSQPAIYTTKAYSDFQTSMEAPRASFYDTLLINTMYKCTDKCKNRITCANNGVQHGADCNKCFCPKGWDSTDCSQRPRDAQIVKLTSTATVKLQIPKSADFQEKLAIVEAPQGRRVKAVVKRTDLNMSSCRMTGLEIITKKDTRMGGYRVCSTPHAKEYVSDNNQLLLYVYDGASYGFGAEVTVTLV